MTRRIFPLIPAMLVAPVWADEKPVSLTEQGAIAGALAPSLVRVEYTLQYDKGEPPRTEGRGWHSAEEAVTQERPLETVGFVLSPTQIMAPDLMIHPRFVKGVAVRFRDQLVNASIAAYPTRQEAILLKLAEPLSQVKPLTFDPQGEPPYLEVHHELAGAVWTTAVRPLSLGIVKTEAGRQYLPTSPDCLVTDRTGSPVGLTMTSKSPTDGLWKGSPLRWPMLSAQEMSKLLAALEEKADHGLLRVALSFRSPKKKEGVSRWARFVSDDGEDVDATERNVVGALVGEKQIMVLANLKPNVTARLERILVHPPQGEPVPASFTHTLKDYGCFLARLDKPLPDRLAFSSKGILEFGNTLLLREDIILQGEKRVSYFQHTRISDFTLGWRRQVYPIGANAYPGWSGASGSGATSNVFLFDPQGKLLTLPVARRKKVSVRQRWDRTQRLLTPVAYLQEVLADPASHADPSNVPLTEEKENRLAWMGVELQALNKELARANNVSDLTRDGQSGALVTYVYPDSPAAEAGIEPGVVLLRLHVEGHPKPVEVRLERHGFDMNSFMWDQLDDIPEQFLSEMPAPWPPAANSFTQALTELGFGTKYKAEFFHDDKVIFKEFEVVEGPRYYDSAPRHKSESLGMTVRDLTYEVRRHFQKKPDDPGVIVSKIEPGSKASVSGIKPYEIITHVNDQPAKTVADFQKLTEGQSELRLSVQRMTRRRLIKIKMTPSKEKEPADAEQ